MVFTKRQYYTIPRIIMPQNVIDLLTIVNCNKKMSYPARIVNQLSAVIKLLIIEMYAS